MTSKKTSYRFRPRISNVVNEFKPGTKACQPGLPAFVKSLNSPKELRSVSGNVNTKSPKEYAKSIMFQINKYLEGK